MTSVPRRIFPPTIPANGKGRFGTYMDVSATLMALPIFAIPTASISWTSIAPLYWKWSFAESSPSKPPENKDRIGWDDALDPSIPRETVIVFETLSMLSTRTISVPCNRKKGASGSPAVSSK